MAENPENAGRATVPAPSATETIYQTPDWEPYTPRPKRKSLLPRLTNHPGMGSGSKQEDDERAENGTIGTGGAHPSASAHDKETSGTTELSPHSTSATAPAVARGNATTVAPAPAVESRSSKSWVQRQIDTIFPPQRTYFGRSRRIFFTRFVLPFVIGLLCLIALVVGLGVGLSLRARNASQNLALPSNTGGIFTGDLTFYNPGLGACGITSSDSDLVCAVSYMLYDGAVSGRSNSANPNANPLCGHKIRIQRNFMEEGKGNRSVDVTVVDRCTWCAETDLDVTTAVFGQLAQEDAGRVQMSWAWLSS